MNRNFALRILSLATVGLFVLIAWKSKHQESAIDWSAALLVVLAPPLVLLAFSSSLPPVRMILKRMSELRKHPNEKLLADLESSTRTAASASGLAHLLNWSEKNQDLMVRYGAHLVTSRYSPSELSHLLLQKTKVEDHAWQKAVDDVSFLAKMAPYYGMFATVMGMLKMLRSLDDFSQITTHVGLALFGTLYGLLMFVIVYAPLQKMLTGFRFEILRRNEMISRWFMHVAQKQDSDFIEEDLGTFAKQPRTRETRVESERLA